jgi:Holliday junction resolvase
MAYEKKMPLEKGHELERKMERFFQLNGYTTQRNIILEGKSGGKHEVDILAEKSDGITTFRVMVECKAWDKPIEKDVISKVAYVARDLGLNKAIVVSLKGWRIGAEKSAEELGVELWGSDEIEQRLGKVALAELETFEFKKVVKGFPSLIKEEQVRPIIENESKGGIFGFGKEEIAWIKQVWLPCYLFQISCSKAEGMIRKSVKTTKIWNLYEALTGNWFYRFENEPSLKDVEAENIIKPRVKAIKIKNNISKTFEKSLEIVTPRARRRYATKLELFGIPLPIAGISIDNIIEAFYPFYIALLKKGEKERIIAVDGITGNINKIIGNALTTNLNYVLETLNLLCGETKSKSRAKYLMKTSSEENSPS